MRHLSDECLVLRENCGAAAFDRPGARGEALLEPGILVDEDRHAWVRRQVLEVDAARAERQPERLSVPVEPDRCQVDHPVGPRAPSQIGRAHV